MPSADTPALIDGLSEIADRYDGYLVDLWGCVHNGVEAFPAAVEALLHLADAGKTVCLLSNGPRRSADLIARLDQMQVPRGAYRFVMSSGEAVWHAFADRSDPFHAALGRDCYHLGPARDVSVFTGNGLTPVTDVSDADFVLNTGPVEFSDTLDDYEDLLSRARQCALPMVCANPDLVVHVGDQLVICAGLIAQRYEEMGGQVAYHGKPHGSVYERCFAAMVDTPRDRVIGIGDGLRTDVLGASNQGIDSLFLSAGIHLDDFGAARPDAAAIRDLAAKIAAIPIYAAPHLRW